MNLRPHLDALRLRLGGRRGDVPTALLPADEGQLALVEAAAVVGVDEVDAGVLKWARKIKESDKSNDGNFQLVMLESLFDIIRQKIIVWIILISLILFTCQK